MAESGMKEDSDLKPRRRSEFSGSKHHPRRHHNTKGLRQVKEGLCELQVQDMARRMNIPYDLHDLPPDLRTDILVNKILGRKTEQVIFTNDKRLYDYLIAQGRRAEFLDPDCFAQTGLVVSEGYPFAEFDSMVTIPFGNVHKQGGQKT